jgi:short subunit dehydrogenase-like uncharacterized protein
MERDFDIILWGATGFTGQLVAEYFCKNYGINKNVRWAIAGRSEVKLQSLRDGLCDIDPSANQLVLVKADSFNGEQLRQMSSKTKVICTTVGPYAIYGAELVSACIDTGTDYCDLTGETPFIRKMIDLHHEIAKEKKVKIVHACGYDSIPSDLGVLFLQQEMLRRFDSYAEEIRFYTGPTKGGLSGGTIASMINLLEKGTTDKFVRKTLGNPYSLNPKDGYRGPDKRDQTTMSFDQVAQRWTAPFLMAGVNTRIVRRSHALQAYEYGEQFRYSEVMGFSKGFKGWRQASYTTFLIGIFVALSIRPSTRAALKFILPKPGGGPSKNARETGYFSVNLFARNQENVLWGRIKDSLDPGYGSTSKMLAESALALALQSTELPKQYGVITPAVAIGAPLVERLKNAGMSFVIVEN